MVTLDEPMSEIFPSKVAEFCPIVRSGVTVVIVGIDVKHRDVVKLSIVPVAVPEVLTA